MPPMFIINGTSYSTLFYYIRNNYLYAYAESGSKLIKHINGV